MVSLFVGGRGTRAQTGRGRGSPAYICARGPVRATLPVNPTHTLRPASPSAPLALLRLLGPRGALRGESQVFAENQAASLWAPRSKRSFSRRDGNRGSCLFLVASRLVRPPRLRPVPVPSPVGPATSGRPRRPPRSPRYGRRPDGEEEAKVAAGVAAETVAREVVVARRGPVPAVPGPRVARVAARGAGGRPAADGAAPQRPARVAAGPAAVRAAVGPGPPAARDGAPRAARSEEGVSMREPLRAPPGVWGLQNGPWGPRAEGPLAGWTSRTRDLM